jgi:hypothetical protein
MHRQRSVAVLVLVVFMAACASGPERIAYTSISSAVDAAQTTLKAWNEGFYRPGVKVDPVKWNGRRDQAQAAYEKFQKTASIAATLAQDVAQKDNAVKIASDAAADLLAFIAMLEK